MNRRNAERRLVKKDNKSFESLKNFAEVNTLEKNVLEDFEYTNIITNDRKRLLRKKIKKGLTQAEQTKIVSAADKKMTKKHDKNLFNDVDELEKRRKLRKKKEMINKKKLFTERKKTISFKKS